MPDDQAWDTLATETPYSCPGFDVRRDRVRLPDGTETEYDYLVDDPSVVVIPFDRDGEVVLVEEWRQAVDRVNLGFPAGGLEPGDDDLAAAAHRELEEETGYVAGDVQPLLTVEPANGIANAVHHYVVATDCTATGTQSLDTDESIRPRLLSWTDLRDRILAGDLRDGRTVLGVLYHDLEHLR